MSIATGRRKADMNREPSCFPGRLGGAFSTNQHHVTIDESLINPARAQLPTIRVDWVN